MESKGVLATAVEPCGARRVESATVVSHRQTAANTHRIRLECPGIASQAAAGQFAMLRIANRVDPLLGRPLAVYDTYRSVSDTTPEGPAHERRYADFVYVVHGRFTTALRDLRPGDPLLLWGPLGNGYRDVPSTNHLLLVAGGIGQTALLTLGRDRAAAGERVTFCWGASRAAAFGDIEDFRQAGMDVHLATLDGSAGTAGTVIDLMNRAFPIDGSAGPTHVACCGPEGMMAAVGRWADARHLGCHVSLEAPMACGIGICFTCVAKVRDAEGGWDYKRTCIEGPVFPASSIVWT
jgi:dihydroorotate dehydrogenase electron transfer subunit